MTKHIKNLVVAPLTQGSNEGYTLSFINTLQNSICFIDRHNIREDAIQNKKLIFDLQKPKGVRKLLWAFSLRMAYIILREAKRYKVQNILIINGEFLPLNSFIIVLAKLFGIKTITCWHDVSPHPGKILNYCMWGASLFNCFISDKIVIFSEKYKLKLNKYLPLKNVECLPLPVYGNLVEVSQKKPIDFIENLLKKRPYFLFLGRVEFYKGLHEILPFFIQKKEMLFLIMGNGDNNYVQKLKKQMIKATNIIFYDQYVENESFVYYLQNCKALILPYIQASQSSLPIVAAGNNAPMISTNNTGISSTVAELGGLTYNRKNFSQLAKILEGPLVAKPFDRKTYLINWKKKLNHILD